MRRLAMPLSTGCRVAHSPAADRSEMLYGAMPGRYSGTRRQQYETEGARCACGIACLPIDRATLRPLSPQLSLRRKPTILAFGHLFRSVCCTPAPAKKVSHLSQANCPKIGEATQFARPTTFGLGPLAYCGALEIRTQSLFIVRTNS